MLQGAVQIELPFGRFNLEFSERGLAKVCPAEPGAAILCSTFHAEALKPQPCVAWLMAYAQKNFQPVPLDLLDLSACSPFQREMLIELSRVPVGTTLSYGDLAERMGRPKAARAIGQALKSNPLPIILPCHRVVNHSGSLGGFVWGAQKKLEILQHEGHPSSL